MQNEKQRSGTGAPALAPDTDPPGDNQAVVGIIGLGYHNYRVKWLVLGGNTAKKQHISFNKDGTPFETDTNPPQDLPEFDVQTDGSTTTKVKRDAHGSTGEQDYHYKYDDAKVVMHKEMGGTSKIIIR